MSRAECTMERRPIAPLKNARQRFFISRPKYGPRDSSRWVGRGGRQTETNRPSNKQKIPHQSRTISALLQIDLEENVRDRTEPDNVPNSIDLTWYKPWMYSYYANIPTVLKHLRVGDGTLDDQHEFSRIFAEVGLYLRDKDEPSIDEILGHLRNINLLDNDDGLLGVHRLTVFSILGWQSMLYLPAFNICSFHELAIHRDPAQPHSGLVIDTYKVLADLSDRPLYILLKAFGNVLPSRSKQTAQLASENSKVASSWSPLYPTETNAYLLHTLLRVHIRWVDTLALHLDYDPSSRTLSLFSCPSFCVAMLQSPGAIHAFAGPDNNLFEADPRANREDVLELLREVLLSFRLLFGQSSASRKLFCHTFEPPSSLHCHVDTLLPLICTMKRYERPSESVPEDRAIYFAARDFPILYERIELVAKELREARPKSMRDLFRDRRDTLQYWTFWLVSLIGGIGIIFNIIQVVLQALSLYQQ